MDGPSGAHGLLVLVNFYALGAIPENASGSATTLYALGRVFPAKVLILRCLTAHACCRSGWNGNPGLSARCPAGVGAGQGQGIATLAQRRIAQGCQMRQRLVRHGHVHQQVLIYQSFGKSNTFTYIPQELVAAIEDDLGMISALDAYGRLCESSVVVALGTMTGSQGHNMAAVGDILYVCRGSAFDGEDP